VNSRGRNDCFWPDAGGDGSKRKFFPLWDRGWEMVPNEAIRLIGTGTLAKPQDIPVRPSSGGIDALYRLRSELAGVSAGISLDADCGSIPRIAANSIATSTSKSPYRGFE
jgi:hypothetical protein